MSSFYEGGFEVEKVKCTQCGQLRSPNSHCRNCGAVLPWPAEKQLIDILIDSQIRHGSDSVKDREDSHDDQRERGSNYCCYCGEKL